MAEIRIRTAAEADLAEILDYGAARHGEAAAAEYLRSFERTFDLLRHHPHAGAVHPNIEPPVRCISHRSHRIFYDVDGATIWILRVLHHAMDERRRMLE